MQKVEEFLKKNKIRYQLYSHPPVYTVTQAEEYTSKIPGKGAKNLFLKSKKGERYFLFILPGEKRANLKEFAKKVEVKKVSFASPQELKKILGVTPGAVSPFNIINDKEKRVEIFIDREIYEAPFIHAHPNVNTASILISREDFRKFFQLLKRQFTVY